MRVGDVFKGYDSQGHRVVGTVLGILTTKWSTWICVQTASGKRLIQQRRHP